MSFNQLALAGTSLFGLCCYQIFWLFFCFTHITCDPQTTGLWIEILQSVPFIMTWPYIVVI